MIISLIKFDNQFNKQIESIQDKFNPVLHEEADVDKDIHALLSDELFALEIKGMIKDLENRLKKYFKYKESNLLPSKSTSVSDLYDIIELLEEQIKNAIANFYQISDFFDEKAIDKARDSLNDPFWAEIDQTFVDYEDPYHDDLVTDPIFYEFKIIIHHLRDHIRSILDRLNSINQSDLHISGMAGVGKTHISHNICYEKLKSGSPALLILGRYFTSDQPLRNQLLDILDIPRVYNLKNFLEALEAAAEAYHVRIPIVIDGLNESIHNGRFSNVWKLGLTGLIQEIKNYKNLVLITTYRNTYSEFILSKNEPRIVKHIYGFGYDNLEKVVKKYFDYYKIKADLTESSLSQFKYPIYLKIFCETKNPERKEEKNIYIGDYTLFEVFDEYLDNINNILCEKLDLYPNVPFLFPKLKKIAEYLWRENRSDIPLTEMVKIVDDKAIDQLDFWPSSKSKFILDEGLLINNCLDGDEIIYFTYDLLGGYLIAKYL